MEETLRESDLKGYLRAMDELDRLAEQYESTYSLRSFDPAERTPGTSSGRSDPTGEHTAKRERLEEDLAIARERSLEAFRKTLKLIDKIANLPEIPNDTLQVLMCVYLDGFDIEETAIRAKMTPRTVKNRLSKVRNVLLTGEEV